MAESAESMAATITISSCSLRWFTYIEFILNEIGQNIYIKIRWDSDPCIVCVCSVDSLSFGPVSLFDLTLVPCLFQK